MYSESIRLRQGALSQVHPIILHPWGTTGYEPALVAAVVNCLNAIQAWFVNITGLGLSFGPLVEKLGSQPLVVKEELAWVQSRLWGEYDWLPGPNVCHLVILRGSGAWAGYASPPSGTTHLLVVGDAFAEAILGNEVEAARLMEVPLGTRRATRKGAKATVAHEVGHQIGMPDEHDPSIDTLMGGGIERWPATTLTGAEMLICQGSKWLVRGA